MLHRATPQEAYRRVELDAFIAGGEAAQLTRLCFAEALGALNRSLYFDERGDHQPRSQCLDKAIASIQALRLGVDRDHALGPALLTVYGNALGRLAGQLRTFDSREIVALRQDILEIEQVFAPDASG